MKAQYVEPSGSLPWGVSGLTLSAQSQVPGISLPIARSDRGIFVWQDRYDGMQAVRRQVISTGGANFLATGGLPLTERIHGRAIISGNFALNGCFLTLWKDERRGDRIIYQLSTLDMHPLLEPNGRELNPGGLERHRRFGPRGRQRSLLLPPSLAGQDCRPQDGAGQVSSFRSRHQMGRQVLPHLRMYFPLLWKPSSACFQSLMPPGQLAYTLPMLFGMCRAGVKGICRPGNWGIGIQIAGVETSGLQLKT